MIQEFNKHDKEPAKYIKHWRGIKPKTGAPYSCDIGYERFLGPEVSSSFMRKIFSCASSLAYSIKKHAWFIWSHWCKYHLVPQRNSHWICIWGQNHWNYLFFKLSLRISPQVNMYLLVQHMRAILLSVYNL